MNAHELLHYTPASAPTRPPLLLVHGICHNGRCWEPHYVPFFTARGHDVYVIHLRSHWGDRSQLDQAGLDDYVADVLAALTSIPGKVILVGHSMGGAIVQKVMTRTPGRIVAAVLLASMVPGSMTWLEKLALLRRPSRVIALKALLGGKSLSAERIGKLPFFDGRLNEAQALLAANWIQPESKKALSQLGSFSTDGGAQPFPLLVLGSSQDYLFASAALKRTARHYHTEAVILQQGCHDLMLDPDWARSARHIADWLDAQQSQDT